MAGIDNNTLLYLRGDSFNDLSSKNVAITNQNCVIDNNSIKVSSGNKLSLDGIFNQGYTGDFTIEFFVKKTSNSSGLALLQTGNSLDTDGDILVEVNIYNNLQVVLSGSKPWPTISNSYLTDNEFSYIAVVKNGNKFSLYQDGKLRGSLESSKTIYNKINGSIYTNGGEFSIKEYRISNIARYTEDFTPPTKPFNSLFINVTSKDFTKADFNVSKLGQETINKVEIIQNNEVKETFTDSYDNLTFNHNGKAFKIVVTYDDNYTEEQEIHIGNSKAKIYLYKEGNECTSLTGGYKTIVESSDAKLTLNRNSDNIEIISNFKHVGIITQNMININDELYFDLSTTRLSSSSDGRFGYGLNDSISFSSGITYLVVKESINRCIIKTEQINLSKYVSFYCHTSHSGQTFTTNIYNIYYKTKENIISINSQNNSSINFSCNNLDNLISITKAEVYINNKLSKSYTSNFDSITYNIDNSLCVIGENNISVRVTYSQGDDIIETVEENLVHTYTVDPLSEYSSLTAIIERVKLLTNTKEIEKNILKSILESKNVEVSEEENKLSILIDKVNELENNKLYLYKDGDECVDVTGGWYDCLSTGNALKLSNKMGCNFLTNSGGSNSPKLRTKSMIPLENYSKLHFEYELVRFDASNDTRIIAHSVSLNGSDLVRFDINTVTSKKEILTLNISNVNSSANVDIHMYQWQGNKRIEYYVYNIWLEK